MQTDFIAVPPEWTIEQTIAYYRERKIGLIMFTVDAETQMGRRRIPNEEIAEAAVFLIKHSQFTTGQILRVDGGRWLSI